MIKYCKKCREEKREFNPSGYYFAWLPEVRICPNCGGEMIDIDFPAKDLRDLMYISIEPPFLDAMVELYKSDPIDYQLKMSQFRIQAEQIRENDNREMNTPHCPKCGSTSITTGARGINAFWGPIGASKTVNRCANCGYTWKP